MCVCVMRILGGDVGGAELGSEFGYGPEDESNDELYTPFLFVMKMHRFPSNLT